MDESVIVEALLEAAGLHMPPDELAEITASYAGLRASTDLLYAKEFSEADPFLVPAISGMVTE